MSYGQPCSSTTAGPPAGPASAYATFNIPALICLRDPNETFVFATAFLGADVAPACASAAGGTSNWLAARARAAALKKRRRSGSISYDMNRPDGQIAQMLAMYRNEGPHACDHHQPTFS